MVREEGTFMNKQQLAAKIWESANQMRSKIEANEYKDYILGFIFYKYLSDYELKFAKKEGCSDEDIKDLSEDDVETMDHIKSNIGYFIAYKDLFSTWINMGKDFDVSNVRDAISAFSRLISPLHKKLFEGIFDTLQTGLSKLGDCSGSQTKAIREMIEVCYNNTDYRDNTVQGDYIKPIFILTHNVYFHREITYRQVSRYKSVQLPPTRLSKKGGNRSGYYRNNQKLL